MEPVTTRKDEQMIAPALYVSLETGAKKWKVGFSTGISQRPRLCSMGGGELEVLWTEIQKAKARFNLPADAAVYSCYEAGRDGFWIARALSEAGIENLVLDSSSILVDRRARRRKSDGLDVVALLEVLMRYHAGERRCCRVVSVPSREAEDERQMQRELRELKVERTALTNRIKGLLATQGIPLLDRGLKLDLEQLRDRSGRPLLDGLRARISRELERLEMLNAQIEQVAQERKAKLKAAEASAKAAEKATAQDAGKTAPQATAEVAAQGTGQTAPPWAEKTAAQAAAEAAKKLMMLRAIGPETAWIYSVEILAWREIRNTRQLGALLGLTPTPYQSGTSNHELGISKAGNRHVRAIAIEAAWSWVLYQPGSALSRWFQRRFADGGPRMRKKGIVALARKLMIALWKYVKFDEMPEGALLKA